MLIATHRNGMTSDHSCITVDHNSITVRRNGMTGDRICNTVDHNPLQSSPPNGMTCDRICITVDQNAYARANIDRINTTVGHNGINVVRLRSKLITTHRNGVTVDLNQSHHN